MAERIKRTAAPNPAKIASPIRKCPSCGANAVEKLLSAPAVHFKGSGFYVTDYAKKSSPSEGSASGESKSESKGALKI